MENEEINKQQREKYKAKKELDKEFERKYIIKCSCGNTFDVSETLKNWKIKLLRTTKVLEQIKKLNIGGKE